MKPLADGKLGPAEAIKFMILAIPPMLAYALPFSAGFAATLAYHRMAEDNELLAAHSGGLSHRSLLAPALATGLALFLSLAALNEYAIPRFLQSMEKLIAQDLTKLMVSSIQRGYAIEQNDLMVYADDVLVPDAATKAALREQGIADAIELRGVVFIDTTADNRIKNSLVTSKAEVYVLPSPETDSRSERTASIIVSEGWGSKENGDAGWFTRLPTIALPIPNAFRDDPKFLTWAELRALRKNPDRMDFVHTRSMDLAYFLARRATTATIDADLRASGQAKLITQAGEPLLLRAGGIRWDHAADTWVIKPSPDTHAIEIEWWRSDETGTPGSAGITRITPRTAFLSASIDTHTAKRELTINLDLRDARVDDANADVGDDIGGNTGSRRTQLSIDGLHMAYDPLTEFTEKSAYELLAIAEPQINREHNPVLILRGPTHQLRREVDNLQREITSKQNERWALASACLIMVITGAITAIRLRDAQPLFVYLWSFFPALASVITIMSGQQLTHDSGAIGLLLLWAGVAGLAAYTFLSFLSIRKH
ncbi:hypothetical protein MNBD_PLANCTO03-984 [hydrothermal vent metagenome]|uniref:Permease YjgP/YjgQ family protein n=1 Tax=hydrothermal vent metagenome TaxID=652676 RepID=A0A3B1D0Q0_9ZZZZ